MDQLKFLENVKAVILDYGEVSVHPPTAEEWDRMASLFPGGPGSFSSAVGDETGCSMTGRSFAREPIG